MKFKVTYKVFSIPNDKMNTEQQVIEFIYIAKVSELGDLSYHINKYLQQFFAVGNYELLSHVQDGNSNE